MGDNEKMKMHRPDVRLDHSQVALRLLKQQAEAARKLAAEAEAAAKAEAEAAAKAGEDG